MTHIIVFQKTFSSMMSYPAMSLGDRVWVSRKSGTGGGGWVHPKGANSMAVSSCLGCEKTLAEARQAISHALSVN